MANNWKSGYQFPILDSSGNPTTTTEDFSDMFVRYDLFAGTKWFAFGYGLHGETAQGVRTNYSSPIQVGSLTTWKSISTGSSFLEGIKTDGTMWTCGYNQFGSLGIGTSGIGTDASSPVQVGSLTTWKTVTCVSDTGIAIKTDGTLWGWGPNPYLYGKASGYLTPVQVGSLTDWKTISGGYGSSAYFVIKTDGTLWFNGINTAGIAGNGTSGGTYSSPIQVGTLSGWKQINYGINNNATALQTDGTLWAWGFNTNGELGNGNNISYSTPIQIGFDKNWKSVSTSSAIKTDGTLWMWGPNQLGQLGTGDRTYYSSPIQIGSLTNWKQIYSYDSSSLAIKTDGTLWAWGLNNWGQLGTGDRTYYSSPIQIGSLTTWKQITGVGFTSYVISL